MHGYSDLSWSGSSLPEITEHRIFHVLFYYEHIRLKGIINCIYPSWLNLDEYYFCILGRKIIIVYQKMNFIHLLLSHFFTIIFQFTTSNSLQNYQNFIWCRGYFILISQRSKGLLAYMFFLACGIRPFFQDIKIFDTMSNKISFVIFRTCLPLAFSTWSTSWMIVTPLVPYSIIVVHRQACEWLMNIDNTCDGMSCCGQLARECF